MTKNNEIPLLYQRDSLYLMGQRHSGFSFFFFEVKHWFCSHTSWEEVASLLHMLFVSSQNSGAVCQDATQTKIEQWRSQKLNTFKVNNAQFVVLVHAHALKQQR